MERIEQLKIDIAEKEKEIENFELDPDKYESAFDELLDEEGDVVIAGSTFLRSTILAECDPIGYRVGLADYVSFLSVEDDDDYKELCSELEELQDELFALEEEAEQEGGDQ